MNANSPALQDYIQNRGEALQSLHHGYAYDNDFVLHVFGYTQRNNIKCQTTVFTFYQNSIWMLPSTFPLEKGDVTRATFTSFKKNNTGNSCRVEC
jgi:hypothetical protein